MTAAREPFWAVFSVLSVFSSLAYLPLTCTGRTIVVFVAGRLTIISKPLSRRGK